MKRLTEWRDGHGALLSGDGYTKLAQYEDTGLEPEEIESLQTNFDAAYDIMVRQTDYIEKLKKELHVLDLFKEQMDDAEESIRIAEARREGRLVVLPFAVGTEVWSEEPFVDGKPRVGTVVGFEVHENGAGVFWASFGPEAISAAFLVADVGKTVFLSKEEAEEKVEGDIKALRRQALKEQVGFDRMLEVRHTGVCTEFTTLAGERICRYCVYGDKEGKFRVYVR